MKHRIFGRKLGRDIRSRKALLYSLASSVLSEGKITTTLAKAKFVQPFVDKLITKAKNSALHRQRIISSFLTPRAFNRLISEIAPGFSERTSGYTRITKLAMRRGDNAPMARFQLLELDQKKIIESPGKKKKVSTTTPAVENQRKSAKNLRKSK